MACFSMTFSWKCVWEGNNSKPLINSELTFLCCNYCILNNTVSILVFSYLLTKSQLLHSYNFYNQILFEKKKPRIYLSEKLFAKFYFLFFLNSYVKPTVTILKPMRQILKETKSKMFWWLFVNLYTMFYLILNVPRIWFIFIQQRKQIWLIITTF